MRTAVDAGDVERIGGHRHTRPAIGIGDVDDVGEVIFLLRIIIGYAGQQAKEIHRLHRHQAGVGKFNQLLRLARILLLDHLNDAAILHNHAAITGGVFGFERQHHNRRPIRRVQPIHHRLHCRGRHKGHIAIEDQHIAVEARKRTLRHLHSMAGAQLRLLHRQVCRPRQCRFQLLLAAADNDDLFRRRQRIYAGH